MNGLRVNAQAIPVPDADRARSTAASHVAWVTELRKSSGVPHAVDAGRLGVARLLGEVAGGVGEAAIEIRSRAGGRLTRAGRVPRLIAAALLQPVVLRELVGLLEIRVVESSDRGKLSHVALL